MNGNKIEAKRKTVLALSLSRCLFSHNSEWSFRFGKGKEGVRPLLLPTTNWSPSVNIEPRERLYVCIPFQFNFFIKKEIILFLCFYGLMVKRFNKDESKRIKERMCALSPCVCVCVYGKLLKIKFFSHSEIFMVQLRLFFTPFRSSSFSFTWSLTLFHSYPHIINIFLTRFCTFCLVALVVWSKWNKGAHENVW